MRVAMKLNVLTRTALLLWGVIVMIACSSNDEQPACVTVETSCQPLYVPTFGNVYANTIAKKCGGDAASCHADSSRSGLSLASAPQAYTALTTGGPDRIVAGDASCSGMIVRVFGDGHSWLMPPKSPLMAAERCALVQWVQNGAVGP
jgi:hypothetical protein